VANFFSLECFLFYLKLSLAEVRIVVVHRLLVLLFLMQMNLEDGRMLQKSQLSQLHTSAVYFLYLLLKKVAIICSLFVYCILSDVVVKLIQTMFAVI